MNDKNDSLVELLLKHLPQSQITSLLSDVASGKDINHYAERLEKAAPNMVKTIFKALEVSSQEQGENLKNLKKKLAYKEKLLRVTNQINAAKNLDEIFLKIKNDLLDLFNAARITIYAVDADKNELFSKYRAFIFFPSTIIKFPQLIYLIYF
ncbi:MAG: hypothetical protein ACMUIP_10790 [bacterium]